MKVCLAMIVGICLFVTAASIVVHADDHETGRRFVEEKCAGCHAFSEKNRSWADIAASGGPDLFFTGSKFKKQWLEKWLVSPTRIRPAGYLPFRYVESTPAGDVVDSRKLPPHPTVPSSEVQPVVNYLLSLQKDLNPYPTTTAGTAIRAEVHFQKLLPCGGCHRVASTGGGLSGPELMTASERLNKEWLLSFVSDPNYWTKELMPKVNLRAEQLNAIGDYLLEVATASGSKSPISTDDFGLTHAGTVHDPPKTDVEVLYQLFCSQCHGIKGNGKGINAPYLFVKPRDHTSFLEMSALTDDRLFAAIKFGGSAVNKSSLMPAWGATLKDSEIQMLVDYLRVLSGTKAQE
jgi:mono/diheme cytochrome c family protein